MRANDPSRRATFYVLNIRLLQSAALLLASLAFSCAGKTTEQTPLSSCGSSCSVEQVTASCSLTCSKLIDSGCYKGKSADLAKCTNDCAQFGNATKCPKAVEFLRCVESVTPTCVSGEPDFGPTCTALEKEVEKCGGGGDVSAPMDVPVGNPTGPYDAGPVVDPTGDNPLVCPNIPRRTVGSGGCVISRAPDGTDAALECTSSCQDGAGNLWEATCNGSTCGCSYNRTEMCTCTITAAGGACPSCCPGTHAL